MTQHKNPRPSVARLLLPLAGALFLAAAGCQTSAQATKPRPAPALGPAPAAEQARAAERYEKNRPVAPAEYRVFPVPPRDNSFAEFSDERYVGLDAQPALPPLPADMPTPARGVPPPPPPGASGMYRAGNVAASAAPARAEMKAVPAAPAAPAGVVAAGGHFYPVEQLVFGGDYPDIDKPELYRLMPKDIVTITIKDHPELSGQVEIQPDGTVGLPNAPDLVRLRGLTMDEAAEAIRKVASVYVKGDCLVRVQANRARGGYYFVFGEVLQPGRFPMGLEPIKLSDAVLAANWEANPARRDLDGDELGPSFPAASPRGRYISPPAADLARVMLITPHRSQPVRTVHDMRSAMLGVTGDDPVVRPGQIVVVPSLDPARNAGLGRIGGAPASVPPPAAPAPAMSGGGLEPARGFSGADSPARLPEAAPPPPRSAARTVKISPGSDVEANMMSAFDANFNTMTEAEACDDPAIPVVTAPARSRGGSWPRGF